MAAWSKSMRSKQSGKTMIDAYKIVTLYRLLELVGISWDNAPQNWMIEGNDVLGQDFWILNVTSLLEFCEPSVGQKIRWTGEWCAKSKLYNQGWLDAFQRRERLVFHPGCIKVNNPLDARLRRLAA
jgi:hypothetical protein